MFAFYSDLRFCQYIGNHHLLSADQITCFAFGVRSCPLDLTFFRPFGHPMMKLFRVIISVHWLSPFGHRNQFPFQDFLSLVGHSLFRYNAKRLPSSSVFTHLVSGINFDSSTGLRCFEIYLNQISSVYLKLFGFVASSTLCPTLSDYPTKFQCFQNILQHSETLHSLTGKVSSLSGLLLKAFSAFDIQLSDLFCTYQSHKSIFRFWQMIFAAI